MGHHQEVERIPETESVPDPVETLVLKLQGEFIARGKQGKSYADIEAETGVGKSRTSKVMNHFDIEKRGGQTLGLEALRNIEGKFS